MIFWFQYITVKKTVGLQWSFNLLCFLEDERICGNLLLPAWQDGICHQIRSLQECCYIGLNVLYSWKASFLLQQLFHLGLRDDLKMYSQVWEFLTIESPVKIIKNASYFSLKASFVLKIFKFSSWFFGHV